MHTTCVQQWNFNTLVATVEYYMNEYVAYSKVTRNICKNICPTMRFSLSPSQFIITQQVVAVNSFKYTCIWNQTAYSCLPIIWGCGQAQNLRSDHINRDDIYDSIRQRYFRRIVVKYTQFCTLDSDAVKRENPYRVLVILP